LCFLRFFFFFQAEVGIRDFHVTGVQTCALPISAASGHDETMKLLSKVVEIQDAERGTVRLRPRAERSAEMTLDTRSTRTVRLGRRSGDGAPEGGSPTPREGT